MEIEIVRKLLTDIAMAHPKKTDSAELLALRGIGMALLHMAEGIEEIRKAQATMPIYGSRTAD